MTADVARALYDQGNAELRAQALEPAVESFSKALESDPSYWPALLGLGVAWRLLGRDAEAVSAFERVLQVEPGQRFALASLAESLMSLRRYAAAAEAFGKLLTIDPDTRHGYGLLLYARLLSGNWRDVDQLIERCRTGEDRGEEVAEPFSLQAVSVSPAHLQQCARRYAQRYYPPRAAVFDRPPPRRKIRIGYVSGEFFHQATSILLTGVLELHDKSTFEVFAFDNGPDDSSELRRRIVSSVDSLVDIRSLTDEQALAAVRECGVDILVNLNGYFGRRRQEIFSRRAAPLQVNYLGFPGTLGAPYMDYLIADRIVIPPEHLSFYDEKVVWMPETYQPNDRRRPIADRPFRRVDLALPEGAFVFCCFNNTYKILPAMFDVWMRIVERVPGSVLWLLAANETTMANLRGEAARRKVDPSRLVFGAVMQSADHLARMRAADLFLDTLPYNAHTTGSDALWAGLPVLTCKGSTFPGRVGASLLEAIGLPELIEESLADYEARAVHLAHHPSELAALRAKLERNRLTTPLFDSKRYTRHLERAYESMMVRHGAGLPPSHIVVTPEPRAGVS